MTASPLTKRIRHDPRLGQRAKQLARLLLRISDTKVRITNSELEAHMGVTKRTVQRAFEELRDAGYGERAGGLSANENHGALPAVWYWGGRPKPTKKNVPIHIDDCDFCQWLLGNADRPEGE